MRRVISGMLVAALLVGLAGCAGFVRAPVVPPTGFVFSNTKAPLDVDYETSAVTGKKGEASSINILGLVAVGDASAKAAAEDAGITRIDHADYSMLSVLGVFSEYTTIVYGE